MCKTHNPRKIDKCMCNFIANLDSYLQKGIDILACCCGHGKYPMTVVCSMHGKEYSFEFISNTMIPRKKKFYKKDKRGYYYIPETVE